MISARILNRFQKAIQFKLLRTTVGLLLVHATKADKVVRLWIDPRSSAAECVRLTNMQFAAMERSFT